MLPSNLHRDTVDVSDAPSTLADIVALIESDAAQSPAEYLEETVVPHGGE